MTQPVNVVVHGAAGRMGQRITAITHQGPGTKVFGAVDSPSCPRLGQDAGEIAGVGRLGVLISSDFPAEKGDVVIDFSIPDAVPALAKRCVERGIALVCATTGLHPEHKAALDEASKSIPLLWSPSMSVAVNLTMKLVREAARAVSGISSGVDVEILERHHRFKEDAPSGTALRFGEIVASEMGQTEHVHGREGRPGARPRNEIGYHAIRTGDNVGEHTIVFGMMGETIDVTVRSHSRDCYAYGAVAAAKFLSGKPAGMYAMSDVLGF